MAQQDENDLKNVQSPFAKGTPGENAFRAAYNRLKREAEVARGNIGRDYAGAYQQLRQQTYGQGLGAAAQSGLSGGQAGMMRNRVSAGQMQALGGLLQGQESAMRQQKAMEGSIYSNALLEGQQAQQMQFENIAQLNQLQQQLAQIEEGGITENERALYNQIQAALQQANQPGGDGAPQRVGTRNYGTVNAYATRADATEVMRNMRPTEGYRYEVRYDETAGGYVVFAVDINNRNRAYPVATNRAPTLG